MEKFRIYVVIFSGHLIHRLRNKYVPCIFTSVHRSKLVAPVSSSIHNGHFHRIDCEQSNHIRQQTQLDLII